MIMSAKSVVRRMLRKLSGVSDSQQKTGYPASRFPAMQSYVHPIGKPVWMARDYSKFADEGYVKNVIAARSVQMIAKGVSNIQWKLFESTNQGKKQEVKSHPILQLLARPNPMMSGVALLETLISSKLISGNAYMMAVGATQSPPKELHTLRSDRMAVIAGEQCLPQAYRYKVGEYYKDYPVSRLTGRSQILHLKSFHPLNDWYGLSPIEAAAYAIDQHNQSGQWNQALLQNGARPSGALVVTAGKDNGNGMLSNDQFERLKHQLDENYSGATNSGRPLLLEGGLEWKEMSMSPKDMDFIEAKNSAARDISLAFGVPPQLLGIPGDNTYSNMAEARLSLWEETIIPIIDYVTGEFNNWLVPQFNQKNISLCYSTDHISALSPKRDKMWNRINNSSFLSDEEKKQILGL